MFNEDSRFPCPYQNANIISKIFFFWLSNLFRLVKKNHILEFADIWTVPDSEKAEYLTDALQKEWQRQIDNPKKRPSMMLLIWRCYKKEFFVSAIGLVIESALITIRPLVVGWIIRNFSDLRNQENLFAVLLHSAHLIANLLATVFVRHWLNWICYIAGMRLRVGASGLIFRKVLKLNQKALTHTTSGQIINLLSTDVLKFEQTFLQIHYTWVGTGQAIIVLFIMIRICGVAPILSVVIMLSFAIIQGINGKILAMIKMKIARQTDTRVKLLSGLIGGMRAVKMYCWEAIFTQLVSQARRIEIKGYHKSIHCQSFQYSQLVYQPRIAMLMLFVSIMFILQDTSSEALTSAKIFTIFGLINSLFFSLTLSLPTSIQQFVETSISCTRIEIDELAKETEACRSLKSEPELEFCHVKAVWDKQNRSPTLLDINFNLKGPLLVGVVGNVGSGKTSLLLAAIGELPLAYGYVMRSEKLAYMPQVSWIFPGTIRENVLCGQTYEPSRYNEVLRVCALDVDCKRMMDGDLTYVGERGVSLSGGQKARIGLARLCYSQTQLVMLDDPLAAVDTKIAGFLFRECIQIFLKDRLRILVTHQHHLLRKMDMIIIMKAGRVTNFGSYDKLMSEGLDLEGFCQIVESEVQSRKSSFDESLSSPLMKFKSAFRQFNALNINELTDDFMQTFPSFKEEKKWNESDENDCVNSDCDNYPEDKMSNGVSSPAIAVIHPLQQSSTSISTVDEPKCRTILRKNTTTDSGPNLLEKSNSNSTSKSEVISKLDNIDSSDQINKDETMSSGTVSWRHYYIYNTIGAGLCGILGVFFFFITNSIVDLLCDIWIAKWTNHQDLKLKQSEEAKKNNSNQSEIEYFPDNNTCLLIYGLMIAILVVLSTIRTWVFCRVFTNAATKIHRRMLDSIVYSKVHFFEVNTSGRILNRFSKDINLLDDLLPLTYHEFIRCFLLLCEMIAIALITSYYVLIPLIPVVFAFYYGRKYYLSVARALKRLEALSPVFTHISVSIQGLSCIRALNTEDECQLGLYKVIDENTSVVFLSIAAQRWISIRLDLLCVFYAFGVIAICVALGYWSRDLGLVLNMSTAITGLFQWTVRKSADVESLMIAVERCLEYTKLTPEENKLKESNYLKPMDNWPLKGEIIFENVWLKYDGSEDWALSGISFKIPPRHKIGIVGRTGAGKSSLISAIFRLSEISQGRIFLDKLDLRQLRLRDARSGVSIIPQDPIMFAGTIRQNLDPECKYGDGYLWYALHAVQLNEMMTTISGGLDGVVHEEGSNLSAGQRQLISLGRVILKANRILIVDEATANVDPQTDSVIQNTIRQEFKECTVLTIAHRLKTIMDSDFIIVMEAGGVAEIGEPHFLLNPDELSSNHRCFGSQINNEKHQNHNEDRVTIKDPNDPVTGNGYFASLVRQTGKSESKQLCKIARDAFYSEMNIKNRNVRLQNY